MNLLVTGAFQPENSFFKELKEYGFELYFHKVESDKLNLDPSIIHGVICNSFFLHNNIQQFVNLKFIQLTSVGFDRVPLEYIKEHGIKLFNAKGVYSIPMAEWVILKILEIYKNSKHFYRSQEQKQWNKNRDLIELTDKTALIIGYGEVGKEVAIRLRAFGVIVNSVVRRSENCININKFYSFENLHCALKEADIVVVTVPLAENTKYILNYENLNHMKSNSVLINISRGGVISEKDVIEHLYEGKFCGVALDVFEEEPLDVSSPLWEHEKVNITFHNSFISDLNNSRLSKVITANLKIYINERSAL